MFWISCWPMFGMIYVSGLWRLPGPSMYHMFTLAYVRNYKIDTRFVQNRGYRFTWNHVYTHTDDATYIYIYYTCTHIHIYIYILLVSMQIPTTLKVQSWWISILILIDCFGFSVVSRCHDRVLTHCQGRFVPSSLPDFPKPTRTLSAVDDPLCLQATFESCDVFSCTVVGHRRTTDGQIDQVHPHLPLSVGDIHLLIQRRPVPDCTVDGRYVASGLRGANKNL